MPDSLSVPTPHTAVKSRVYNEMLQVTLVYFFILAITTVIKITCQHKTMSRTNECREKYAAERNYIYVAKYAKNR